MPMYNLCMHLILTLVASVAADISKIVVIIIEEKALFGQDADDCFRTLRFVFETHIAPEVIFK